MCNASIIQILEELVSAASTIKIRLDCPPEDLSRLLTAISKANSFLKSGNQIAVSYCNNNERVIAERKYVLMGEMFTQLGCGELWRKLSAEATKEACKGN
jgi:hypothetical protein